MKPTDQCVLRLKPQALLCFYCVLCSTNKKDVSIFIELGISSTSNPTVSLSLFQLPCFDLQAPVQLYLLSVYPYSLTHTYTNHKLLISWHDHRKDGGHLLRLFCLLKHRFLIFTFVSPLCQPSIPLCHDYTLVYTRMRVYYRLLISNRPLAS